jgi:hypothetical protein
MDWIREIIQGFLGALFGGSLIWLITMKATRRKANAEAKYSELENIEKAIAIWRGISEQLEHDNRELRARYTEEQKKRKPRKKKEDEVVLDETK